MLTVEAPLTELIMRSVLVSVVLAADYSATSVAAALPNRAVPEGPVMRGGSSNGEARMAVIEHKHDAAIDRLALLERNHHELSVEVRSLDRQLAQIQAVAEANTQANWVVGSGFVAQFLFSMFRYLKAQPKE